MKLIIDYPSWVYALCVLVGIVFSFLLYYREKKLNQPTWLYRSLSTLRFLSITLLTFLLFNPQLFYKKEYNEKPILAVLYDNSSSVIANSDSLEIKQFISSSLPKTLEDLSENFDVQNFTFGEGLFKTDTLSFTERTTNLSEALLSVSDRFYNQNLSGVIVISDGIINEGNNPLYTSNLPQAKIYTLAVGDTTVKKDVAITNLEHNKIAFLNNKFPVKLSIKANKYLGKVVQIDLLKDGKLIDSKKHPIQTNEDLFEEVFLIQSDKVGIQKFTIKINHLPNEQTYINNTLNFFVEVLNSKQNILLLANAPHPDIAAIKSALDKNGNYHTDVKYSYNFKESNIAYDAIVLHNLPTSNNALLDKIISNKTPKLFIVGTQTNLNLLQKYSLQIPNSNSYSDASAELNSTFPLFTLNTSSVSFNKLPPLKVPFATKYGVNTQNVLFFQKIGSAKTNYPLMGFYQVNETKAGYLLGEGIWRWKFAEYQQNKSNLFFDDLIQKSFQYLTVKEDKSRFRVYSSSNAFYENEDVIIGAELYNKTFQLTNEPDASLELVNDKEEKFMYQFSKINSRYNLNLGKLLSGNYTYTAQTNLNGETFIKTGAFVVNLLLKERLNLQANHKLLNELSFKTGGQMFYPSQIEQLKEVFNNAEDFPSIIRYEETTDSLLNLWGLLCLIIILVSTEWFLRKYFGSY